MFKLIELTIGSFIIVKANDFEDQKFPVNVHGVLNVVEVNENKYVALLVKGNISNELANSNELEELKNKAIELTDEVLSEEFSD